MKADGDAQVVLSRNNEEDIDFADLSVDAITKLVNDYRFPLFGELNGETFGDTRPARAATCSGLSSSWRRART